MESLEDIMVCPSCNSDLSVIGTDELEFGINHAGHARLEMWCPNCKKWKELAFQFTYNITEAHYI